VWIGPGIFQHEDGRLFFTERYVYANRAHYGMGENTLRRPFYWKRFEVLNLVWPRRQDRGGGWTVDVVSKRSLDLLVQRRNGKADGEGWLTAGAVWGADEVWYSLEHLARQIGRPVVYLYGLLRAARGRGEEVGPAKRVPRPGGGTPLLAFHQGGSWVRGLLRLGGSRADNGGGPAAAADTTLTPPRAPTPTRQRGRGRPRGSIDREAAARNERMRQDWAARKFPTVAALARHYHVSRSFASEIVNNDR
jgi:hypothetical protein